MSDSRNRMRDCLGAIAATCLLCVGSLSGASWTPINAGLPSSFFGITTLTVDPSEPSTLFAITSSGNVFESTDGAASWKAVSGLVGATFLAMDPLTSSTIYAATHHGIFKSTDGGGTWAAANGDLTDNCFMLVIDPVTPTTVYGLSNGPIFKTTDGGGTWKPIHATISSNIAGSLVIDPMTPSTLYASLTNAAIVKSTDGGESWMVIKTGLPFRVWAPSVIPLAVDPRIPSTLYAGSFAASRFNAAPPFDTGAGSISKSTDGGQTWNTVRAGIPGDAFVRFLALDPASPSTLYAAYSSSDAVGGILKSADGGESWSVIDTANFQGSWIAVDTAAPSTIYAAYSAYSGAGTISKSTDAGSSWKPSNEGLAFPDLHVLAVDPANGTTVYTGGAGGLFKRDDAGGNWINLAAFQVSSPRYRPAPAPAAVRSLLIDFKNPNILYAETLRAGGCAIDEKTVFKSTDGGATWSDSISPPDSGCVLGGYSAYSPWMAMDPANPDTLYLGETEDEGGFYALLKSTNGGASWTSIWKQSGLNVLAINPLKPTTLYAGVGNGVFKSTDGGASWNVTGLKDTAVTVLTIDPGDPNVLYAVTQGIYTEPSGFSGVYKSTDAGASWAAINQGLTGLTSVGATITSLVIGPNNLTVVYAGTSGDGIYKSVDGGEHWVRFNDGLTNLNIRAMAIAPGTRTVYAATAGGVFKAADDGS